MNKNTADVVYLSKSGMKKLKSRIGELEREAKRLMVELKQLDKGTKKEDYLEKVEILTRLNATKSEIEERKLCLQKTKLLAKKRKSEKVSLGSFVELLDRATGKIFKFMVVDSLEVDPSEGKISVDSPLGKNLIDKKVKDTISWVVGMTTRQMVLVRIG